MQILAVSHELCFSWNASSHELHLVTCRGEMKVFGLFLLLLRRVSSLVVLRRLDHSWCEMICFQRGSIIPFMLLTVHNMALTE